MRRGGFIRCALYQPYCRALQNNDDLREGASQFVVIMEPDLARFRRLAAALKGLSVVRTTSPLDGLSLWMEVFALGTNKSGAAAFLAARLGMQPGQTYALGNDFNDADLLEWAAHACVTANAPVELRQCYSRIRPRGGRLRRCGRLGALLNSFPARPRAARVDAGTVQAPRRPDGAVSLPEPATASPCCRQVVF